MNREPPNRALAVLAITAPSLLATVAVLTFLALDLAGRTPLSHGPVRNIAEAAFLAQGSEVLRLFRAREDPMRAWPVRPEITSSAVMRVTALEAAVWSRRAQVIELFDRQAAIVDDETRRHLLCLAHDLRVQEVIDYLSQRATADCTPGEALEIVLARSREAEAGGASR